MTTTAWLVWYATGFLFHCALAETAMKALKRWPGYLAGYVIGSLFWPVLLVLAVLPSKGERFWPTLEQLREEEARREESK